MLPSDSSSAYKGPRKRNAKPEEKGLQGQQDLLVTEVINTHYKLPEFTKPTNAAMMCLIHVHFWVTTL